MAWAESDTNAAAGSCGALSGLELVVSSRSQVNASVGAVVAFLPALSTRIRGDVQYISQAVRRFMGPGSSTDWQMVKSHLATACVSVKLNVEE